MKNLKVRFILVVAVLAFSASAPVCAASRNQDNPHAQLVEIKKEEAEWTALLPAVSGAPVFELDHGNSKVYTLSSEEKERLITDGWEYKGPAFYSAEEEGSIPVYRLHNDQLNFVYSLTDSVPGYTLDGIAFMVHGTASTWQTITLDADRDSTIVVHKGQNIVVYLNGHNVLPKSGPAILVEKGGTVLIKGNGNIHAYGSEPAIRNNGCAVINGGRFENNGNYCVINHGNMIINGGEFTHTDRDCVSSLINTGYQNYYSGNAANGYVARVNYSSPMLTINGGDFHGGRWLIKSDDNGRCYINGGTFHDARYSVIKNWVTLEVLGGTFTARENGETYGLITNGHVQTADPDKEDVDPGTLDIYGGTFTPGAFLFYPANNSDGQTLIYGNIAIHSMQVVGNAAVSNPTWPVSDNYNYNQIKGVENIDRDL